MAKTLLMHAALRHHREVGAACLLAHQVRLRAGQHRHVRGIHGDREGKVLWMVPDDEDRPHRHDAEHRRGKRAEELQRAEGGEPQHRAGVDHHVPAENDRLHLERPRREEVGGPLEAEAADAEGGGEHLVLLAVKRAPVRHEPQSTPAVIMCVTLRALAGRPATPRREVQGRDRTGSRRCAHVEPLPAGIVPGSR